MPQLRSTGGYSDWRLPNPHELMSLFNYETGNPAMNATYFPPASPSAEYWWSRDVFGTSTTNNATKPNKVRCC
jgi:hypothetical protein